MQPTVAVWAYIMAAAILVIGFFLIIENIAADYKARGLRDQMRTLILLTSIFSVAWWITGNSWIISPTSEKFNGITSMRGMIPDDCKNGNMGDRSFYHFLLAMIIILDVLIPICGAYVVGRTFLNRTFSG
uniref:Uncharacterized protein n=1 Tax=Cryptomonas curvata TaxID=233186 RepID=A0A6T8BZW8_9CRYP|mmetsp:Transcript_5284/g.11708  ORF Transcript_5284/g.11708 Transcript_5284/m.11708 type:complete len:130 (+) Transcript_5284:379-768(+)